MQTIHLNSNNFRLFPRVYMVQNDTGRDLKMVLDDITLAGTETGAVAIKRSDGSYYTISATLVSADNAFTADMTQALTQPGLTECQLKVTASDDTVISSYTFMVYVQPSTDGVPEEQLGYSIQDLMDAAQTIVSGGITPSLKAALLQIASKVVYIDEHGQDYYDALYLALNPPANLVSISAVYTQSGTVYDTDSLDSLKEDLVVTAIYSDSSTETLSPSTYTLSGTLSEGTSIVTVNYGGKTTTFNVVVTHLNPYIILLNTSPNENNGGLTVVSGRATYLSIMGVLPLTKASGISDTDVYPMLIPNGTTTINATYPNGKIGIYIYHLNSENTAYVHDYTFSWSTNTTFNVSGYGDGSYYFIPFYSNYTGTPSTDTNYFEFS